MFTRLEPKLPQKPDKDHQELVAGIEGFFHRLNEKGALAIQPQDISHLPIVAVADYTAPGTTDHTRAIMEAAAALSDRGGGILDFEPGVVYSFSLTAHLMSFSGLNGVVLRGNGCTLDSALTNGTDDYAVAHFNACNNVHVSGFKVLGSNTTLASTTGEIFVQFENACKNVVIENCVVHDCSHMAYGAEVDVSTRSVTGLSIRNVHVERTYYGFRGVFVYHAEIRMSGVNTGRIFYPINCKNIEAWIEDQPGGAFSGCLIKTYTDNTQSVERNSTLGIALHYRTPGRYSGSGNQNNDEAYVSLEVEHAQATDAPGTLANISIDLTADCTSDKAANLVTFRKFDLGSVDTGTADSHVIRNIDIDVRAINCENLRQSGIVLFPVFSSMSWTGDLISNVRLGNVNISGASAVPTDAIYINGQGSVSGERFVQVDNYQVRGAITMVNATDAEIQGLPLPLTPVLSFGGASTGITYAIQTGSAVLRDGRCRGNMAIALSSNGTATGAAKISGLPFTVKSNSDSYVPVRLRLVDVNYSGTAQGYCDANTKTIALEDIAEAGTVNPLDETNFPDTSIVFVDFDYQIA